MINAQCSWDGFISSTHSTVQIRQLHSGIWRQVHTAVVWYWFMAFAAFLCTRYPYPYQIYPGPWEFLNHLGKGIREKCFRWFCFNMGFFNELVNLCCLSFTRAAMCFVQLSLGKANGLLPLQSWVGEFCMSKAKAD